MLEKQPGKREEAGIWDNSYDLQLFDSHISYLPQGDVRKLPNEHESDGFSRLSAQFPNMSILFLLPKNDMT